MIKKIFNAVRKFITMGVQNEEESKDLAVLLRVMCTSYLIFFLIISVILSFAHYYYLSVAGIIVVGASIAIFVITYEGLTNRAMYSFIILSILSAVLYTCVLGWKCNIQWIMLIAILVIFFSIDIEIRTKMIYLRIISGTFLLLAILTQLLPQYTDVNAFNSTIYHVTVTLFYCMCFGFLAYRYCIKYNETDEQLKETNNKLKQMASVDALTQLINRRQMNENLSMEVYEFTRNGTPFAVAIADVDFFKKVNDNYGHDTGDYVLKELASIFKKTMEGRGSVARWGGEEFLFCFKNLSGQKAVSILDVMRRQIEAYNFTFKEQQLNITITIGVEEYTEILGLESTISSADAKLYKGKTSGRNQVVF